MAILDPIYATPLAVRLIPNVDRDFAEKLGLRPEQRSIGLITADNDDATYVAIDEATKMADVEVAYARSFYAGAATRPACCRARSWRSWRGRIRPRCAPGCTLRWNT
jgi:ethanolamine utilization microcompartment shell protein EutL